MGYTRKGPRGKEGGQLGGSSGKPDWRTGDLDQECSHEKREFQQSPQD